MSVVVGDNAEPMPDVWQYPTPDAVFESAQHRAWVRGTDVALADAELDPRGTE